MAGVDDFQMVQLEPRPFRPFKTSEEYLYAMKEDLAEWLHTLYNMDINAENFMERLETGVVLCRHANNVLRTARDVGKKKGSGMPPIPERDVVFRAEVQPGTFHARDNVSNFISWCRALAVKECLLFETDDLVLRKNERSFILCLLEVARKGTQFGMLAPLLVQMEQEIEAEIANDCKKNGGERRGREGHASGSESDGHEADDDSDTQYEPPPAQIITNDLRSLHERVVDLLNRCSCPSQFPMIRVADGKYRIGDTQILIFVRILRNHVMVRVGGGWDTLEHYLDKHDPCRCRAGHRFSTSAKLTMVPGSGGSLQMQVTYNRPQPTGTPSSSRSSSVPTSPPSRRRSFDLSRLSYQDESRDMLARGPSRSSHCSDDSSASSASLHLLGDSATPQSTCRGKSGHPSSADSSSEVSEGEGKAALRMGRQRKYSPRKIMRIGENSCDSDSLLSSLSPPESLEYQQHNGTGITEDTRPLACETPLKSVKDAPMSPCGSDTSGSAASTTMCPDDTSGGGNTPRSKIPKSKSPSKKLSTGHRCHSTEDLSNCRLSASRSEACLLTNSPQDHSRTSSILKNRRASAGGVVIYGRGSLPRSSSTCHDGDHGFSVYRSEHGKHKTLMTDVKSKVDCGNKTWSGRQRSPRSTASPEVFRSSSASRTPPKSPAKSSDSLSHKNQRPTQSPVKPVPPLLEEILNDDLLDSDEKILEKMERLINQYRTREEKQLARASDDYSNCSASPDEGSSVDENGFPVITSPSRAKTRRKCINGSPSKIPVFTWQRRD